MEAGLQELLEESTTYSRLEKALSAVVAGIKHLNSSNKTPSSKAIASKLLNLRNLLHMRLVQSRFYIPHKAGLVEWYTEQINMTYKHVIG